MEFKVFVYLLSLVDPKYFHCDYPNVDYNDTLFHIFGDNVSASEKTDV